MTKKSEVSEILPGVGLGILKFGMTRDQVKLILGTPDDIDEELTDGIEGEDIEAWHYDDFEISMEFSESTEWRLVSLATSAEYTSLNGSSLIGKSKEELEKCDIEDLIEDVIEDEEGSQVILVSENSGLNFWMEDGKLMEVQWVPLVNEEEEIEWPEY